MTNKNRPIVLTIAASDSAGMAGVQMDLKVQTAFEVHSMSALTANTAQNNQTVLSINCIGSDVLEQQLNAIADYPISVIKVGLIADIQQVKTIAKFVDEKQIPMIFDPVIASTSKVNFFDLKNIPLLVDALLPYCTLITPNLDEAALLTQLPVNNFDEMELAAHNLLSLGAENVLIKGGHLSSDLSQDFFLGEEKSFWLSSERQTTNNSRGTGCALASAISSSLALGYSIYDAVVIGKMAVNQGLRESYSVGGEKGPLSITRFPDKQIDLPLLTLTPNAAFEKQAFAECNQPQLGLYPIVDRADWISRLAPQGVTTIQLRVKDLEGQALELEIKSAVELAQKHHCRLFINDYWQLAIKYQAYGVHLGQEDLDNADLKTIQKAGGRLGISSHCHYEVARAISHKPSYIACGPIFHTNTKQMPWVPQGIEGLAYWCKVLQYPLVAIGGISQQRVSQVVQTGVDSVAMITAITQAEQPELVTEQLIKGYF